MTKIYLISEEKILDQKSFAQNLQKALATSLVPVFQLRLKNYPQLEIEKIAQEAKKICHDYGCLFLLNDDYKAALKLGCHGVHLGADDGKISEARKIAGQNFIIGASCYGSRDAALQAVEEGASYISFGTFFLSKTKNSKGKPTPEILSWANEIFDVQVAAIGGINDGNCAEIVRAKADFLCVISYVWQSEDGVAEALKRLDDAMRRAVG